MNYMSIGICGIFSGFLLGSLCSIIMNSGKSKKRALSIENDCFIKLGISEEKLLALKIEINVPFFDLFILKDKNIDYVSQLKELANIYEWSDEYKISLTSLNDMIFEINKNSIERIDIDEQDDVSIIHTVNMSNNFKNHLRELGNIVNDILNDDIVYFDKEKFNIVVNEQ